MGTRRPTMQPERVAAVSEPSIRQTLDARVSEAVDLMRAEPSPQSGQAPAPRPVSPAFSNRPCSTVVRGGAARLGGQSELMWALRELRDTDPSVLRAEVRRNPEAWAKAQENLHRLVSTAAGLRRC